MRFVRWNGVMFVAVVAVAGSLVGCRKDPRVDLPQDFHGPVTLLCGSSDAGQPIDFHVPQGGNASGFPCPGKERDLVITRGGEKVTPEEKPVWHFTGDGVPVSIEFRIR